MAISTAATNPNLLKQYWHDKFLTNLRANLVFWQFGQKSSVPDYTGTVAWWLTISDLSAGGTLTDGTTPTESNLTSSYQSAAMIAKGDYIKLSDVLQDTAVGGTVDSAMEKLGRGAALAYDIMARDSIFTAGGTAQYAGTAIARNSIADDASFDMDVAEVRKAVHALEKNNVPAHPMASKGAKYIGIVGPDAKFDLIGDTNWQNTVIYTDKNIDNLAVNNIGTIYGVSFYETTQANALANLANSGSASTDIQQSYFFGDQYFGCADFMDLQMIVKNPAPDAPLNQWGNFGYKYRTAVKELGAARMVRVESASSLESRN